ncbi:hypothetical protein MBT84_08990 [Streptomyces sp. MBT84]|nr:hypothetical protein [Streptomyces sp. MBT84]
MNGTRTRHGGCATATSRCRRTSPRLLSADRGGHHLHRTRLRGPIEGLVPRPWTATAAPRTDRPAPADGPRPDRVSAVAASSPPGRCRRSRLPPQYERTPGLRRTPSAEETYRSRSTTKVRRASRRHCAGRASEAASRTALRHRTRSCGKLRDDPHGNRTGAPARRMTPRPPTATPCPFIKRCHSACPTNRTHTWEFQLERQGHTVTNSAYRINLGWSVVCQQGHFLRSSSPSLW